MAAHSFDPIKLGFYRANHTPPPVKDVWFKTEFSASGNVAKTHFEIRKPGGKDYFYMFENSKLVYKGIINDNEFAKEILTNLEISSNNDEQSKLMLDWIPHIKDYGFKIEENNKTWIKAVGDLYEKIEFRGNKFIISDRNTDIIYRGVISGKDYSDKLFSSLIWEYE